LLIKLKWSSNPPEPTNVSEFPAKVKLLALAGERNVQNGVVL
jgi:hypothetical protein